MLVESDATPFQLHTSAIDTQKRQIARLPMTALKDNKGFLKVTKIIAVIIFIPSDFCLLQFPGSIILIRDQVIRDARRISRRIRVGTACKRCKQAHLKVFRSSYFLLS
jgi:hypothetical protein